MNLRKNLLAVAGVALSFAAAGPALAAPVSYSLAGTFAGMLSGEPVSINAMFTGLGDTNTANAGSSFTTVNLSSLSLTAGTVTYNFVGDFDFFTNTRGIAGFSLRGGHDILTFNSPALSAYDLRIEAPLTPVAFGQSRRVYASDGEVDLLVTSAVGLVFSSDDLLGVPSVVPEPASWLLMIAGFGMIGTGMRRSSRHRVAAS